jgi:hypothetical protein
VDFTIYDWLFGVVVFVVTFVWTWRWLDNQTEGKRRRS